MHVCCLHYSLRYGLEWVFVNAHSPRSVTVAETNNRLKFAGVKFGRILADAHKYLIRIVFVDGFFQSFFECSAVAIDCKIAFFRLVGTFEVSPTDSVGLGLLSGDAFLDGHG